VDVLVLTNETGRALDPLCAHRVLARVGTAATSTTCTYMPCDMRPSHYCQQPASVSRKSPTPSAAPTLDRRRFRIAASMPAATRSRCHCFSSLLAQLRVRSSRWRAGVHGHGRLAPGRRWWWVHGRWQSSFWLATPVRCSRGRSTCRGRCAGVAW